MQRKLVKPDWASEEHWKMAVSAAEQVERMGLVESVERIRRDAVAHREAYESSGGKEGYTRPGAPAPCLLLTTIGRKTGKHFTTPVNFMQDGEKYVVVGSLAGNDKDPIWALNLKATPQAWIQVRDKKTEVAVHLAAGEERKRLWPLLNYVMPLWEIFQQQTDRQFPVFVLTPKK